MPARKRSARQGGYRNIRIMVLLVILFFVAVGQYLSASRATNWDTPLSVALHPIVAEDNPEVRAYVAGLEYQDYQGIDEFFSAAAIRHGLPQQTPVQTDLGRTVSGLPPLPEGVNSAFGAMLWSLKFRFWTVRQNWQADLGPERIHLFLLFHEASEGRTLPHSVGLEKGQIGIAHLFASKRQRRPNQVVIAHELLHTLGASDKYGLDGLPLFPEGFAEPERAPRYPQRYAELMAGRTPLSTSTAKTPSGLGTSRIGLVTACEINWCED